MNHLTRTRPQAVVFGAGNVGRGFLGQLFSESGYDVVFVDVDHVLIDALNARGAYTMRLVSNDQAEEVIISPVRALHADDNKEEVIQSVAEASIGATAVGARALPHIAPLVAAGIMQRFHTPRTSTSGTRPGALTSQAGNALNIIICENLKDAAMTFRGLVREHLPPADSEALLERVGFVDTVIARMAPPPTPAMRASDPGFIIVEPYKRLPVDRRGFVGPIPEIVGMEAHDNFAGYTASKLYIHNCGHATLGYLGFLRGHVYGWEALQDSTIRSVLDAALAESRQGITAAYGMDPAWLGTLATDIVNRFANRALGDTVFRLARDPLRKLRPEDRLVGPARLAEKAGITPEALSWSIAAGYCFDHADDPLALALQQHLRDLGFDAVLADVSGITPDEPLAALVRERYNRLRQGNWPGEERCP